MSEVSIRNALSFEKVTVAVTKEYVALARLVDKFAVADAITCACYSSATLAIHVRNTHLDCVCSIEREGRTIESDRGAWREP